MPKYLQKVRYTQQGIQGLLKDGGSKRREMANAVARGLGATIEACSFAFEDPDAYIIVDAPNDEAIAAVALASGHCRRWGNNRERQAVRTRTAGQSGADDGAVPATGRIGPGGSAIRIRAAISTPSRVWALTFRGCMRLAKHQGTGLEGGRTRTGPEAARGLVAVGCR